MAVVLVVDFESIFKRSVTLSSKLWEDSITDEENSTSFKAPSRTYSITTGACEMVTAAEGWAGDLPIVLFGCC